MVKENGDVGDQKPRPRQNGEARIAPLRVWSIRMFQGRKDEPDNDIQKQIDHATSTHKDTATMLVCKEKLLALAGEL